MYYKNGTISNRPPIPVSNPKEEHYRKFGWLPYKRDIPEFNPETQKIEQSEVVEQNGVAVQEYNVVDLTEEELNQRRQNVSTEKWKLEIVLDDMDLLDSVNQIVSQASKRVQIAWNKTSNVNRMTKAIQGIAKHLDLSARQVDSIFREANKIEI